MKYLSALLCNFSKTALFFVIFILSGCVSPIPTADFAFSDKDQGIGIVAYTINCDIAPGIGTLHIEPVHFSAAYFGEALFSMQDSYKRPFICDSLQKTTPLYYSKLPAGQYNFIGWQITPAYNPNEYIAPIHFKNIRFMVYNHRVTYIGRINLFRGFGKKIETIISGQYAVPDILLIRKHLPKIPFNQIKVKLAHFEK